MRAVLACVLWCAGGVDAGLVWSDEFNGGSLDEGKWNYDLGTGSNGWGNNELQSYTKGAVRVGGGVCSLELTRTHGGAGGYESGKIHTRGKGDFRYGRFEARIKLPTGRGTWPAFWMLPTGSVYGGWPRSGEIDILEHVGYNLGQVHGTVHTQAGSGAAGTGGHTSTDVTQFHVYAVVWTPTQIDWYLDGAHFFTYRKTGGSDTWPFNQDFYLILNLAYGGDWGGAKGVDDSIFSRRVAVEVDYVRVYDDVGGSVPVPVPGPVPTPPAGGCGTGAAACDGAGCFTCRQRMDYLKGQGQSEQAAGLQVAREFPNECAGCGATCNLDARPCGSEGCYTCRQRLDYLQNTNGMSPQAAGAQLVKEYPQECAGCEAGLSPAGPAPVPVTPSPPTPTCNLDAKPCGSEGCYTCRQRLDYLQNTNGMSSQAAGAQLVKEYPQECAGCEDGLGVPPPAPPTSGQRHVRIMTYNLFGWNALRDAGKTRQMLDQVKKVGPDVLGTQETEGKTSMIASWVGMQAVGPERHGVQIFVNPARFSVMAAGTFNLQEQDQWGQRIGMWARLWDRTANREYVHVNTHLCVCSSTQLLGSATTLATQLSRIAGTKPAVLTGDLNVFDGFANSRAVRYLTGQTVSGRRSPAPLRDAVPQGGSTFQSGGRIDYVLYKGMVRQNSWVEPRTGSDHHPVVADLSL